MYIGKKDLKEIHKTVHLFIPQIFTACLLYPKHFWAQKKSVRQVISPSHLRLHSTIISWERESHGEFLFSSVCFSVFSIFSKEYTLNTLSEINFKPTIPNLISSYKSWSSSLKTFRKILVRTERGWLFFFF